MLDAEVHSVWSKSLVLDRPAFAVTFSATILSTASFRVALLYAAVAGRNKFCLADEDCGR